MTVGGWFGIGTSGTSLHLPPGKNCATCSSSARFSGMAKKETTAKKTEASEAGSTPFTFRLDPQIRAELEKMSAKEDRSLSWLIHRALRYWLDNGAK